MSTINAKAPAARWGFSAHMQTVWTVWTGVYKTEWDTVGRAGADCKGDRVAAGTFF